MFTRQELRACARGSWEFFFFQPRFVPLVILSIVPHVADSLGDPVLQLVCREQELYVFLPVGPNKGAEEIFQGFPVSPSVSIWASRMAAEPRVGMGYSWGSYPMKRCAIVHAGPERASLIRTRYVKSKGISPRFRLHRGSGVWGARRPIKREKFPSHPSVQSPPESGLSRLVSVDS